MKKYGKKALALGLVVGMAVFSFPVSATTKPTLSNKTKTIAVGDTTTLTVQNKAKKATYKWISSNKRVATVTQKGSVKGKKAGTTTITCVVTRGKETIPLKATIKVLELKNAGSKIIVAGEKSQLAVNPYKGATYQWRSDNRKVATVDKNGVVTGQKVGTTKVRCIVESKKKSYIVEYTIKVNTKKTVTTQQQLNEALKNKKLTSITISTKKKTDFTILDGTYKNVDLFVNAPNADVQNYGVFKSVSIQSIKPDTWHEYAKGNTITLQAKNAHLVVEEIGSVNKIEIPTKDAQVELEINGTVKQMVGTEKSELILTNNGTVEKVVVKAVSNLQVKGTSEQAVPIEIGKKAEGTKIDSAIPVQVITPVKVEITLQKGAEGSSIEVTKEVGVTVSNQTDTKVTVKTPTGEKEIEVGQTITTNQEVTEDKNDNVNSGVIGNITGSSSTGTVNDQYEIADWTVEKDTLFIGEKMELIFLIKKNGAFIKEDDIDLEKIKVESNENVKVIDYGSNGEKVGVLIKAMKEGEGVLMVSYGNSIAKTFKFQIKQSESTEPIETMELSELQNAIYSCEENGTYELTKYVTIPSNEILTIPENKTLVIADNGNITVEKDGKIKNEGNIETKSNTIQTFAVKERKSSVPKLTINSSGNIYVVSGSSIQLEQLEDISENSDNSIICYPGGEIFIGDRKYVGYEDTALIRFSEEALEEMNSNSMIGFGRNGDGEVSLFITKEAIISEKAEEGEVDCNFILKGEENGKQSGKLTLPSLDVINLQVGSIHAESGSTLIVGGKTYFAPTGVEESVFTVTEGSVYNNSKGITIYSRGNEEGLIFWVCGEITMNEALSEENVFCMKRGAYINGKPGSMSGTLTLNLTSDEEEVKVAKNFIVGKENYHSVYVGEQDNPSNWILKD